MSIIIGGPWHTDSGTVVTSGGYPTTYFTPTNQQLTFSDVSANLHSALLNTAAAWNSFDTARRDSVLGPGCYYGSGNFRVVWNNAGGDWYDSGGNAQGSSPFGTVNVPISVTTVQNCDITSLVNGWTTGTFTNYGMMIIAGNSTGNLLFHSRWNADPNLRPFLTISGPTLGSTVVPCGRSVRMTTTQNTGTGLGESDIMQIDTNNRVMFWFDLTPYAGKTITSGIVSFYPYNWFGTGWPMTVKFFRLRNPEDQSAIPDQTLGLAANYVLDSGIETDPNVLFVQKFTDANFKNIWFQGSDNSSLITSSDGNGFTRLLNTFNGLKCTIPIGVNSAFQAFWSPWNTNVTYQATRLKPAADLEEAWCRYYFMYGNDWNPLPNAAGKLSGIDGRYLLPGIANMGSGNSGAVNDGLCGWSARGSYDAVPPANDPLTGTSGIGFSGDYNADSDDNGSDVWFVPNHYLTAGELGKWTCIEFHLKLNTVTQPAEIPRVVTRLSRNGTLATATLAVPMTPEVAPYTTGSTWSIGGCTFINSILYCDDHVITVVDSTHFTYTVPSNIDNPAKKGGGVHVTFTNITNANPGVCTCDTAIPAGWNNGDTLLLTVQGMPSLDNLSVTMTAKTTFGFTLQGIDTTAMGTFTGGFAEKPPILWNYLAVPGTGNKDGVLEMWINGRFAGSYTTPTRWRNSRLRPDGGVYGIDNFWFILYNGGAAVPSTTCSAYYSNIVVAKSYIGPIVQTIPTPPLPAWLTGKPTMQWIELTDAVVGRPGTGIGTGMDKMDYSSIIAAGYTTSALADGGRFNAAIGPFLTVTNITNANPGVVTVASTATLTNGQQVRMFTEAENGGIGGCMQLLNLASVTVQNKTATTFEMAGVNTTAYGAFSMPSGFFARAQPLPTPGDIERFGNPITCIVQGDSGGGLRPANSTLLCYGGGGDECWAGNDLRGLCLEDNSPIWKVLKKPTDVSLIKRSAHSGQWPNADTVVAWNDNGSPCSGHSYQQLHFVESQHKFYRIGYKQCWQQDTSLDAITGLDVTGVVAAGTIDTDAANTWDAPNAHPTNPNQLQNGWDGPPSISHPYTEDFYTVSFKFSNYTLMKYSPTALGGAGQWTTLNASIPTSGTDPGRGCGAIDPRASIDAYHGADGMMLVIQTMVVGAAATAQVYNLTTGFKTAATFTGPYASAAVPWAGAPWWSPGLCFDLVNNYFIHFIDDGFLYTLTQTPGTANFVVDRLTLTGTPLPQYSFSRQSTLPPPAGYVSVNKWVMYVPNLKGVALFPNQWSLASGHASVNCYFVKTAP